MKSIMTRRNMLTRATALFLPAVLLGVGIVPASAHETSCPTCKIKVTQDTAQQDNEVALRYGRKRIEYSCVWCAITDANAGKYKSGDLTVLAPSEKKGQPIPLERKEGKWSAPEGTVFVGVKASHKVCYQTYRAFTNKAAFDAYVQKNKTVVKGATPLTIDQLVAQAK